MTIWDKTRGDFYLNSVYNGERKKKVYCKFLINKERGKKKCVEVGGWVGGGGMKVAVTWDNLSIWSRCLHRSSKFQGCRAKRWRYFDFSIYVDDDEEITKKMEIAFQNRWIRPGAPVNFDGNMLVSIRIEKWSEKMNNKKKVYKKLK